MVVGSVNAGGVLPEHWIASIVSALEAGLNVATGLHVRLASIPEIAEAAARGGAGLHDVRFSDVKFATGKGTKRPGRRVLTVGTDCSVGKKYTALALEKRNARARHGCGFPRHRPDRRVHLRAAVRLLMQLLPTLSQAPWSGSRRKQIPTTGI